MIRIHWFEDQSNTLQSPNDIIIKALIKKIAQAPYIEKSHLIIGHFYQISILKKQSFNKLIKLLMPFNSQRSELEFNINYESNRFLHTGGYKPKYEPTRQEIKKRLRYAKLSFGSDGRSILREERGPTLQEVEGNSTAQEAKSAPASPLPTRFAETTVGSPPRSPGTHLVQDVLPRVDELKQNLRNLLSGGYYTLENLTTKWVGLALNTKKADKSNGQTQKAFYDNHIERNNVLAEILLRIPGFAALYRKETQENIALEYLNNKYRNVRDLNSATLGELAFRMSSSIATLGTLSIANLNELKEINKQEIDTIKKLDKKLDALKLVQKNKITSRRRLYPVIVLENVAEPIETRQKVKRKMEVKRKWW